MNSEQRKKIRELKKRKNTWNKMPFWIASAVLVLVVAGVIGGYYYFPSRQTKAGTIRRDILPTPDRSTYDSRGFLINLEYKGNGKYEETRGNFPNGNDPGSRGDSCGHMGIQAIIFCLAGKNDQAYQLYLKCNKIDFYRHPDIYDYAFSKDNKDGWDFNGTSQDQLLPWYIVTTKWPNVSGSQGKWKQPSYHQRHTLPEFQWETNHMNLSTSYNYVWGDLQQKIYAINHGNETALKNGYFRNWLTMLKVGLIRARGQDPHDNLLALAREYNKLLEGKTTVNGKIIPNVFFNWILGLGLGDLNAWYQHWYLDNHIVKVGQEQREIINNAAVGFEFGRDPSFISTHQEWWPFYWWSDGTLNGERLSLGRQFVNAASQKKIPENSPKVINQTPAKDAKAIAVNTNVTATFNDKVIFVDGGSVYLRKNGTTTNIAAKVTYDEAKKIVTLNPDSDLAKGTKYTVTVSKKIEDFGRTSLRNGNYVWNFTTIEEQSTPPVPFGPKVAAVSPKDNATRISVNSNVSVTFDKSVENVNENTFYLTESSDAHLAEAKISAKISLNTQDTVAVLDPEDSLKKNTHYVATVTKEIQDKEGHKLENNFVWSFTTVSDESEFAPPVEPTVAGDLDGDQDVDLDDFASWIIFWNEYTQKGKLTPEIALGDRDRDDDIDLDDFATWIIEWNQYTQNHSVLN